jgi:hypothetical protein
MVTVACASLCHEPSALQGEGGVLGAQCHLTNGWLVVGFAVGLGCSPVGAHARDLVNDACKTRIHPWKMWATG